MNNTLNQKIKRLIKKCDLFQTFITFRINDDFEYKSLFGGISTIFFISITLLFTISYSINFIKRKNIDLIYSNKILEKEPFVNLTESKFNLAFGIQRQNDGGDYKFEKYDYFNYSFELIEWNDENNLTFNNLYLRPCSKEDFYHKVDESFSELHLESLLCSDIKNLNFTLNGLYTDKNFKFLRLNLSLSDYAINNLEELQFYLNKIPLEMAIYFIDTSIDYQKQYNYMTSYINYIYRSFDLNIIKYIYIFISPIEFLIDDNLLFENPKTKKNSKFDYSYDTFRFINRINNIDFQERLIGQIIIQASSKIIQFNRTFQKLPSFIADLSGILEKILIIIFIIVNIIERKLIDDNLINRLIKFKGSKYYNVNYLLTLFNKDRIKNSIMKIIKKPNLNIEKKQNISSFNKNVIFLLNNYVDEKTKSLKNNIYKKNTSCLKKRKSHNYHVNFPDFPKFKDENIKISPDLKQINSVEKLNIFGHKMSSSEILNDSHSFTSLNFYIEKKLKKKKKFNKKIFPLTIWQNIFASMFFWYNDLQKKRYEIIKKAENKIHYYLDIFMYITKMQEIDLLKYCLLNKNQITLFDFLSRPPIKIDNQNEDYIYHEFETNQKIIKKFENKEMEEIFKTYNGIRNKKQICFEDIKLLRLIRAEVDFLKN